jgi:aminoglycoside/choline kinase family phosphotransferase
MTLRLQEIKDWLTSLFPTIDLSKLNYMQSDASSRKYLRLETPDNSFVIMDTKPDKELDNFIALARILAVHKINAPEIIHCNTSQGLVLLNDFGSKTYLETFKTADVSLTNKLYLDAVTTLIKLQGIPTDRSIGYELGSMNSAYIGNRLEVFKEWYLQKHLGLTISTAINTMLDKMEDIFNNVFTELPPVFVHVDYHCRNLMHVSANNPGVLDFQDAMMGPPTYDLVSLFQDAYIKWPRSYVESWVSAYARMASDAGTIPPISKETLLRNFDLVGLQRHIKNLGVFARLHHRDNKSNYLNDMPTLLQYINTTCARYTELNWLQEFIKEEALG